MLVCVCARTTPAGLACLHRAHPHLTGDPCAQAGSASPPRWASRPGEPFAGLPKCFEGAGQKEVSYAGQRAPARAARVVRGGVTRMGLVRVPPPREARSLLYENRCPAMDSCGASFGEDQRRAFGDYLELAMQSQYNKRNL